MRTPPEGSASGSAARGAFGFEVLVVSPGGTFQASLPIAAARAGAVGLLDLSCCVDTAAAVAETRRLTHLAAGVRFGVVLDARLTSLEEAVLTELEPGDAKQCDTILLVPRSADELHADVARCRLIARRIGLVVTSLAESDLAASAGADFIIAKGHEAGGRVGEETTFVLLQRLLAWGRLPVVAWGGVGLRTGAACLVAGASGVVLDWQLALVKESPLPHSFRRRLALMDGSETIAVPTPDGSYLRFYWQPGMTSRDRLLELCDEVADGKASISEWDHCTAELLSAPVDENRLWPVGQDGTLAAKWASAAPNVARALAMFHDSLRDHAEGAAKVRALAKGGPLAVSHRTDFPVVQGPMTRVSDVPEFALAVAQDGGLPFLALALMNPEQVRQLLEGTRDLLGERPWGVGVLGFVDRELRARQFAVIEEVRPPFAIIAGGRPDQAASLEARGIATYLHVPSPGMLSMFVAEGARRFVFEGRECGGHVGPRSSFVLWECMIETLLAADLSTEEAAKVHLLFAGGIHDDTSGAIVSALAQPLVERGMKIGVLLGTAYLFTKEIVATGAIVPGFQEEAIHTTRTVLLETGPGHSTRCAETRFYHDFEEEKQRLKRAQRPAEEIREALEMLNLGRLRIASKGISRAAGASPDANPYVQVGEAEQHEQGMYMIGQVAALRSKQCTIRELHETVCDGAMARLAAFRAEPRVSVVPTPPAPPALDIAIIGMSCMLPGAPNLATYWRNMLAGRDVVGEIPADRFDHLRWFDPDRAARDKIYSKWGGFIDDVPFDPLKYGIPPLALRSIEPMQLLALALVDRALGDAGYDQANPNRERTSVILGAGGGIGELGTGYAVRAMLPQFVVNPDDTLWSQLPEWTEDSFAGILLNVVAGRVSNRFDLGGVNYTVDAACASSLAAVYLACRELADFTSDMVITGGCDTLQSPFTYLCFGTAGALSPRGKSRTFDAESDGIAISEGLAAVVLKRREDAERDGDRIYAVIRAVAGGSDGRSKGMATPRAEGQMRTIERAYAQARFSPSSVQLFEAHGTGTAVGDQTECESLSRILEVSGAAPRTCAVGSVKSMIGHTKCAAGVAGLIRAALALYHRVLPPTLHVERPNPKAGLLDGPLYVNSELRPWIRGHELRRAAVSSFGFGGTNFHAVLEEYAGEALPAASRAPQKRRAAELFTLSGNATQQVAQKARAWADEVRRAVAAGADVELADLAYTWHRRQTARGESCRTAIVATTTEELLAQLDWIAAKLAAPETIAPPRGVYFAPDALAVGTLIAFLFPGQGSQYPDMLRQLAIEFHEVRERFELADEVLRHEIELRLSHYIFPPPAFDDGERRSAAEALRATDVLQPALGACDLAIHRLLGSFGVTPSLVAGHSYGELVALCAAGGLDEPSLYRLSRARGRAIAALATQGASVDLGGMLAVSAGADVVSRALGNCPPVWIANHNSPRQTIISGTREGLQLAQERLEAASLSVAPIAVSCGFHSPLVEPARRQFAKALADTDFVAPRVTVYGNSTAAAYPASAGEVRRHLGDHLTSQVRFVDQIEAMYESGARVFVEVGPGRVLSRLTDEILGARPHLAVATQTSDQDGVVQFLTCLAQLFAHGVAIDAERLYLGRDVQVLDLAALASGKGESLAAHTWLVNGGYARPAREPRRTLLPRARLVTEEDSLRPATVLPPHDSTFREALPQVLSEAAAPAPIVEPISTVAPMAAAAPTELPLDALADFQRTMQEFLITQQAVMTAYFTAQPISPTRASSTMPSAEADEAHLPRTISAIPPTAAIVPPMTERPPAAAPTAPAIIEPSGPSLPISSFEAAVASPATPAVPALDELLIKIVSERTGYPADMLGLDANLEAELGIDSIKRVEIIGAFRRAAVPATEEPAPELMEQLTSAATLRAILDGITNIACLRVDEAPVPAAASVEADMACVPPSQLRELLTSVVSERTGYPAEMLELDANLEADFGIDSIKRVEIIGAFRRAALPAVEEPPASFMEEVTAATTMRGILAAVEQLAVGQTPGGIGPKVAVAPVRSNGSRGNGLASASTSSAACPRCVPVVVEAPLETHPNRVLPEGVILLTDEGQSTAAAVAASLSALGATTFVLGHDELATREAAEAAIRRIRATHGSIGGVVHLLPLADAPAFPQIDRAAWDAHFQREVRGMYFLLQALAPELSTARDGNVPVVCFTIGGGDFNEADRTEATQPWRGGLAGLMKTAAKEWPRARFRAVDLDRRPAASVVVDEIAATGPVEVGYRQGRRLQIVPREEPLSLAEPRPRHITIDSSSVILLIGGARGITAEVARQLAQDTHATLVLVGRTPVPAAEEEPLLAEDADPATLRPSLITAMRTGGALPSPREVEDRLQRLLAARDVRRTIADLQSAGSRVEYLSCDVRQPQALAAVVGEVRRRFGKIDGVIHAAGVIEDKYIADKSAESFDRVVGTKVEPLLTLSTSLAADEVRFFVLFSSIAGFFGNAGQADYAIANEILNRAASRLSRVWPGTRVVALNWGPWQGAGMVTPEVARQFESRGVGMLHAAAGRRAAIDELEHAADRRSCVLLGPGPWVSESVTGDTARTNNEARPSGKVLAPKSELTIPTGPDWPLLNGERVKLAGDGTFEARIKLDLQRHRFLRDHAIDERPVLPAVMGMELMVEAAHLAAGGAWHVARVEDMRVLSGVIMDRHEREITLRAAPIHRDSESGRWRVEITDAARGGRSLYRATVHLSSMSPVAPPAPELVRLEDPFPLNAQEAYDRWLFHGPAFRSIVELRGMDGTGIDAVVSSEASSLDGAQRRNWLIDPAILDAAPQLALLWSRAVYDTSSLPYGVADYYRYGPLGNEPLEALLRIDPATDDSSLKADVWLLCDGTVVGLLVGMECASSAALNRIGGSYSP